MAIGTKSGAIKVYPFIIIELKFFFFWVDWAVTLRAGDKLNILPTSWTSYWSKLMYNMAVFTHSHITKNTLVQPISQLCKLAPEMKCALVNKKKRIFTCIATKEKIKIKNKLSSPKSQLCIHLSSGHRSCFSSGFASLRLWSAALFVCTAALQCSYSSVFSCAFDANGNQCFVHLSYSFNVLWCKILSRVQVVLSL